MGTLIMLALFLAGWDYLYDGYDHRAKETEREPEMIREVKELKNRRELND